MINLSLSKTTRRLRTAIAAALALVLVALAPGLAPYEAAAQVFSGSMGAAGRGMGAPVVPAGVTNGSGVTVIPAGTNLAPALNSSLTIGVAPSVSIGLVAAPGALSAAPSAAAFAPAAAFPVLPSSALLSAPSAAASAPVPAIGIASALRAPAAAAGLDAAAPGVRGQLAAVVQDLDSARDGAKTGFLDKLYTGARGFFGLSEPSPVAASDGQAKTAPSASFAALTPAPALLLPAASTQDEGKAASSAGRATPPTPVSQVSDGLNPGSKLLDGAAAKPEAPVQGPSNDDWIDTKGMIGMFAQRSLSIGLFIMTALAYPLIAIHAVGAATFGVLMALGPLAAIATGPLNGFIADKLSPRNGLILLSLFRAVQVISLPLLAHFGLLNFWTLLGMSIANGWQLSLLMTSENAYLRRLAGKNHLGNLNALNAVNYLALQVVLTLIFGVGALIDKFGPMMPYYLSAIMQPLVIVPIIWFMVPNTLEKAAAKVQAASRSFSERMKATIESVKSFLRKYWKEIGLFGASFGAYVAFHTTLPMSGALFFWVSRTDAFKAVWNQKNLRAPMLLGALAFGLIFPFQYMALPLMAGVLGGAAGKAAILGQMLGALFFGQLAANASQANLPSVKIPFTNYKVPAERLVQGLVLALGALWSILRLFPGNWLAAAASVAVGSGLMYGASKFTDKGWVKFLGIGLAAASILPLVFWGSLPVMFAGMLALGLFTGPVQVALNTYFGKNARAASVGNAFGASSSLNNTATSFGYGLLTLLIGLFHPMFPRALGPISVGFMIIGGIFFFLGPKFLPGMSEKLFASRKPAEKKS